MELTRDQDLVDACEHPIIAKALFNYGYYCTECSAPFKVEKISLSSIISNNEG